MGLRSGDVWVEGSRRYADFEGYLLPKDVWAGIRSRGAVTVDVNPNVEEFLSDRKQLLDEQLRRVSELAERNELPEARLGDGRLHFSPLQRSTPEEAEQWAERAYDLLPRKLTDLLVEVDGWTNFTDCFTHLHSGILPNPRMFFSRESWLMPRIRERRRWPRRARGSRTRSFAGRRIGTFGRRHTRKLSLRSSTCSTSCRWLSNGAMAVPARPTDRRSRSR